MGTAAAAWAEAGGFGGSGGEIPVDVGGLGERDGAYRAAVDAGGDNAGEEAAVETAVAAIDGLPADDGVEGGVDGERMTVEVRGRGVRTRRNRVPIIHLSVRRRDSKAAGRLIVADWPFAAGDFRAS